MGSGVLGSGRSLRSHETDLRRAAGKTWIQIQTPRLPLWSDFCSWIQRHSQMQPRIHELDGALGLDRSHGCVHILWHNIAAWAINPKPDSRLLRLQLSGHPGGTSCSRPCTCRAEDRTCYYLVVAATTYLSPKRGLEATCQAQKGALSRVLHGSELHHRAERAKKRFP